MAKQFPPPTTWHAFTLSRDRFTKLLKSERRAHIDVHRQPEVGHGIRFTEAVDSIVTGRQAFAVITHTGDVRRVSGRALREVWFKIAATEACELGGE